MENTQIINLAAIHELKNTNIWFTVLTEKLVHM